jgi:hypothetical protein
VPKVPKVIKIFLKHKSIYFFLCLVLYSLCPAPYALSAYTTADD